MGTSLYLTTVLPASIPSAALKLIVIVGPSLSTRCTAIPSATTAATIGITHTTDTRARRRGTTTACATPPPSTGSSAMASPRPGSVPDQPRIEGLRRQHCQHDHRGEEQDTGPRLDRHQRLELHERDRERVHEHVQHRPAADRL